MFTLFRLVLSSAAADVPDVFRSPFQVAPLDLDSDAFYPTRREQLDKRLTQIADGQAGWCCDLGTAGLCMNHRSI